MNIKEICFYLSALALIGGLTACDSDTPETKPSAAEGQQIQKSVEIPAIPQAPAKSGKVVEKLDASNYTYVRLDDGSGTEIWAAVPKTQLEIGEEITLMGGSVMRNFTSKTLNRTFESIIFANSVVKASDDKTAHTSGDATGSVSKTVKSKTQGMTSQSASGSRRAIVSFAGLKVEKATAQNGHTVGELFAKATELDKQKVTIKGRVVKISPNIMGKNWFHIQDGTGDPTKNTHDLVVTSSAIAEKGAILSFEGVVAANKDFGSGYKYDVIVEDAVIVK